MTIVARWPILAPGPGIRRRSVRLRYVVFLFIAAVLVLAVRGFVRGGGAPRKPVPVSLWPWLLVPAVIALVVAFGFGLKRWALD